MNTHFTIDLTQRPTTLDLFHISLAAAVLVLALLLVFLLLFIVIGLSRKPRQPDTKAIQTAVQEAITNSMPEPSPPQEPEVKIVEVEKVVEKIVPGPPPEPVILKEATPDAALQLLSLLQKEARFIDFIKEDIDQYSDADIGAAARVVHEGCNQAINEHFSMKPVRTEPENSKITLQEGFDASRIRLIGNIVGKPPFTGTLVHKGWEITDVHLPKITEGHNVNVIAAAEVEL